MRRRRTSAFLKGTPQPESLLTLTRLMFDDGLLLSVHQPLPSWVRRSERCREGMLGSPRHVRKMETKINSGTVFGLALEVHYFLTFLS